MTTFDELHWAIERGKHTFTIEDRPLERTRTFLRALIPVAQEELQTAGYYDWPNPIEKLLKANEQPPFIGKLAEAAILAQRQNAFGTTTPAPEPKPFNRGDRVRLWLRPNPNIVTFPDRILTGTAGILVRPFTHNDTPGWTATWDNHGNYWTPTTCLVHEETEDND